MSNEEKIELLTRIIGAQKLIEQYTIDIALLKERVILWEKLLADESTHQKTGKHINQG